MVDDVAEVFLHLIVHDGMVDRFELLHDGDLPPDDAAQGDDIAAQQGDLLDDLLGVGFEERVFDGVDAFVDLVEDGEDVVDELVEQGVEGVICAATEQTIAFVFVRPAGFEGGVTRGLSVPLCTVTMKSRPTKKSTSLAREIS